MYLLEERAALFSICTLRDIFNPSYVFFESMKFWSSSFFLKRIILMLWQDYILCVANDAKLEISLKIIYSFSFYKIDYNILFEKKGRLYFGIEKHKYLQKWILHLHLIFRNSLNFLNFLCANFPFNFMLNIFLKR